MPISWMPLGTRVRSELARLTRPRRRNAAAVTAPVTAVEVEQLRGEVLDAQARLAALMSGLTGILSRSLAVGDLLPWEDLASAFLDVERLEVRRAASGAVDIDWLIEQAARGLLNITALSSQLLVQIDLVKADLDG